MRPKNPELLKHKQRKQNVQPTLQAVGSAFELGQELLQLLQPQAQPCTPSGGSCLALALASRLFFCNINERENVLVARTGKSRVCAGPRAEQLQQHLCCEDAVRMLWGCCDDAVPPAARLVAGAVSSAPLNPGAKCWGQAPELWEQQQGWHSCESGVVWVWHQLWPVWKRCCCHVCQAMVTEQPPVAVGRVPVPTYINRALLHFYLKRLCSFQIIACSASQSTFFILQITQHWFQRGLRSSFIAVGRKG